LRAGRQTNVPEPIQRDVQPHGEASSAREAFPSRTRPTHQDYGARPWPANETFVNPETLKSTQNADEFPRGLECAVASSAWPRVALRQNRTRRARPAGFEKRFCAFSAGSGRRCRYPSADWRRMPPSRPSRR
jgi:hypothetical protein